MISDQFANDLPDRELLASVAAGDARAFSRLYDRFSTLVFSLAVKILRDAAAAEDLAQEVFVQIWERAACYDPRLGRPVTWVVTLTRNRAIDQLRATQRGQRLMDAAAQEQAVAEQWGAETPEEVVSKETGRLVRAALKQLPPEQRHSIELAFFGGLTQTEIAGDLRLPLGTVKARIRRGMMHMRDELKSRLA
jgi:RNA polymerase sigma-70 factor (ECF subfamily)